MDFIFTTFLHKPCPDHLLQTSARIEIFPRSPEIIEISSEINISSSTQTKSKSSISQNQLACLSGSFTRNASTNTFQIPNLPSFSFFTNISDLPPNTIISCRLNDDSILCATRTDTLSQDTLSNQEELLTYDGKIAAAVLGVIFGIGLFYILFRQWRQKFLTSQLVSGKKIQSLHVERTPGFD